MIKPRFKTQQQTRPTYDPPPKAVNANQNNNDVNVNRVTPVNQNVNQEVNQLDKDSEGGQKKKKEKRGFLQRFEKKDKNKSRDSNDASKEGNVESMEYKENSFAYSSGENNEDLGSPPPRDVTSGGYQQKNDKVIICPIISEIKGVEISIKKRKFASDCIE